jgi:hypothetical protein
MMPERDVGLKVCASQLQKTFYVQIGSEHEKEGITIRRKANEVLGCPLLRSNHELILPASTRIPHMDNCPNVLIASNIHSN